MQQPPKSVSARNGQQPFVVFYAWQSDSPNSTNRGFIKDALEKAIKDVNREISIDQPDRTASSQPNASIQLDHDTQGVPGSPDLASTILEKINASDLFVADISFTGSSADGEKKLPNPNVLVELGYALAVLGPDQVLMILNTATGSSEELPFDIRHKRHITYRAEDGNPANPSEKQRLVKILSVALHAHFKDQPPQSKPVEIDLELTFEKQDIVPANKQWGFSIRMYATNKTSVTIENYELVALLPKGLFSEGSKNFQNPAKNTDTHLAFVYPQPNQMQKKRLMPGKTEPLLHLSCLLYIHNLGKIWDTLKQSIEIDFYADNTEPQHVEFNVKDINPYRLLKVDQNRLQFNKTYKVQEFPDEEIKRVEKCNCH